MEAATPRPFHKTRFWVLLVFLLGALCAGAMLLIHLSRQAGDLVQITQDGVVVGTYPLDQDVTLRFDSKNGGYNVVVIEGGTVRVSEASCPDQVCVRKGRTDQTADPIVCLPNALVVEVIAGSGNSGAREIDGVS